MAYTGVNTQGSSSYAGGSTQNPTGYAGNSFGALKYNLNSMLGWVFGKPTGNDVYIYSDMVFVTIDGKLSFADIANPDVVVFGAYTVLVGNQVLSNILNAIMVDGDNVLLNQTLTPIQYKEAYSKSDGLLGMSFLPWNVMALLDKTSGNYNIKTYYDGGVLNVNPLRTEVLWIKLFTFLKISGISLGSYALIKIGMRKYKND
jgi:hypothetical protein